MANIKKAKKYLKQSKELTFSELAKAMPLYPKPVKDKGRVFKRSESRCKLCHDPHRGQIEDLLNLAAQGVIYDKDIVTWFNFHGLSKDKLSGRNVFTHKQHMSFDVQSSSPAKMKWAMDVLNDMKDKEILSIVRNSGLASVITGETIPTVSQALAAETMLLNMDKNKAQTNLFQEWAERISLKNKKDKATVINSEAVEVDEEEQSA